MSVLELWAPLIFYLQQLEVACLNSAFETLPALPTYVMTVQHLKLQSHTFFQKPQKIVKPRRDLISSLNLAQPVYHFNSFYFFCNNPNAFWRQFNKTKKKKSCKARHFYFFILKNISVSKLKFKINPFWLICNLLNHGFLCYFLFSSFWWVNEEFN